MARAQRPRDLAALVLAAALAGGNCGGGSPSFVDDCPNDIPAACSPPAPSYASEVMSVLHERCGGCHTAGGMAAVHPFDIQSQVQAQRVGILGQLHSCLMPPADQPQLSATERATLLAWLVCGAPDN